MHLDLSTLTARSTPQYGQLALAVLLILCGVLIQDTHWSALGSESHLLGDPLARGVLEPASPGAVSLIYFLPDQWMFDRTLQDVCRWLFYPAALLWLLQIGVPYAGWIATALFTITVSIYQQRWTSVDHTFQTANVLLILHAVWYQACATDIRAAISRGAFYRTPLYPRWVFGGAVLYLASFYVFSGVNKLMYAGLDWPNGLSLQLWIHLFGDASSSAAQTILADRQLATILQWGTLLVEIGAATAVWSWWLRTPVGLGLIAMHFGTFVAFDWLFLGNIVCVALVFLPVAPAVRRATRAIRDHAGPWRAVPTRRWKRAIFGRLDYFGRLEEP